MNVRPVAETDLPVVARIARANDEPAATDPRYVDHLSRHGRFLVAETDDGLAGYCAVREVGGATMLCDLFVDPERHGGGTGRRLLDVAFEGARERFTFASRDPRAVSLYVRFGMTPRWPMFYLSGPPTGPGPLQAERVTTAEAAAAEETLTGHDRSADYAFWGTQKDATGLVVRDAGATVAAGAATPDAIFHLVTGDHDPEKTLASALDTLDADRVRICLPGPHPALPWLLDNGWRIDDLDQHMSSRTDLVSPTTVLSPSLA